MHPFVLLILAPVVVVICGWRAARRRLGRPPRRGLRRVIAKVVPKEGAVVRALGLHAGAATGPLVAGRAARLVVTIRPVVFLLVLLVGIGAARHARHGRPRWRAGSVVFRILGTLRVLAEKLRRRRRRRPGQWRCRHVVVLLPLRLRLAPLHLLITRVITPVIIVVHALLPAIPVAALVVILEPATSADACVVTLHEQRRADDVR
mmetsp:Transcript_74374/g.212048  ORF Transcript_74374/g.212048 Transcript_74374/m.212048 type:complete len:205 (-) Transcript_74374:501-1115(-)